LLVRDSSPVRVDRVLGLVLVLVALAWLWLAYTYIPGPRGEGETGPRAFPVLLGVVLAGLGVAIALNPDAAGESIRPITRQEAMAAGGTIGVLLLYAFLLERVGFLLATPVSITLAMWGLVRERRATRIAALAIGFTVGCWAIFGALLGTPLPRGSWVLWLR
jgi:putative tricarboxylic transport membrane protein